MPKTRYTVYNTEIRRYLRRATLPLGSESEVVTEWTRRAEDAQSFPGKKSAEAMVRRLGSFSELVVKNAKGEIVG